jgi:hypothetical protein
MENTKINKYRKHEVLQRCCSKVGVGLILGRSQPALSSASQLQAPAIHIIMHRQGKSCVCLQ